MKLRPPISSLWFLMAGLLGGHLTAAEDLTVVSNALSPRVAYDLRRDGGALRLTVEAGTFDATGKGVIIEAGIAADKTLRLAAKDARVRVEKDRVRYDFTVPAKALIAKPDGWKSLRVALAVEWAGSAGQPTRLRQSYLHVRPRAAHAGLSVDPSDWRPVDLDEWERHRTDRALQIAIDYDQPLDGKATIVIDDAKGKRVRNLIAAQPLGKGRQRIVWDGIDEQGHVAPPGDYRWRAVAHPGLAPNFLFDFVNGPGSNHGTLHAATSDGRSLFLASPVAEGGHEIIELAPDGSFQRGFNPPHGHGLKDVALAVDEKFLYVVHDGMAWGEKVDRTKPDWKGTNTVSIMRVNLETWSIAEFPGNVRFAALKKYDIGPGSAGSRSEKTQALAGFALVGGKLFLGDAEDGQVMVIDPATAKIERTFPLAGPAALAAAGAKLFAVADGKLQQIDAATGQPSALATLPGKPAGLAIGPAGRFYVSDQKDHVVRVFDAQGKAAAVIGHPGGIAPGPYDPLKFHQPNGLVIAHGWLWITEKDRWEPKRLSAYDLGAAKIAKEYFGPTNYGAQSAGFDDAEHTRWIGQGTLFDVDFQTGHAKPLSILGGESGRRHTFWRQDGRTFVLTSGQATWIQELTPHGTFRPRALLSSAHQFAYAHEWRPPQAFVDAFTSTYPQIKAQTGARGGSERFQPQHGYGMLWVDRNGDAGMQAEEIEFSTAATNFAGSGWSHDFHDLTIRVPAEVDGKKVLVTLQPEGWWPGGAPRYPALNDAVRAGVPIDLPGTSQVESAVDRFGNTILNSSPDMRSFSPAGQLRWTYRNLWSGVHGSHDAPLPRVGQLQGALFFSGVVPLDDQSDVMLLNGNHGQAFLLTSDGLVLIGDTLLFKSERKLFTLPLHAPPGTAPKLLPVEVTHLSTNAHDGWVAAALESGKQREVFLGNLAGEKRPITTLETALHSIEIGPEGGVYALVQPAKGENQILRLDTAAPESARGPWPPPGNRLQWLTGHWFGVADHGTIRRFSADFKPAPGVVLGGASGSFIGYVPCNYELENANGLAHVGGNLYAVSGRFGVLHLLEWQPADRRFEIIRRIGAVQACPSLGLDSEGRVWFSGGVWQWGDGPDAPLQHGVPRPTAPGAFAAMVNDEDELIATGFQHNGGPIFAGKLDGPTRRYGVGDLLPKDSVAAAVVTWDKKRALLAVNASGKGVALYLDFGNPSGRTIAGQVELQTATPIQALTTLVATAKDTLLAAADGFVIEFAQGPGNAWKETRRWNTWGENKDRFGAKIFAAYSKGKLWITDSDNHRALCFNLAAGAPAWLGTFGTAGQAGDDFTKLNQPAALAVNGVRAVIFDAGNQRLVRLELEPAKP